MAVAIVAEIGINHNGNINRAYELMSNAKEAGTDYVKFQLWQSETFPHLEQYRVDYDFIYRTKKYAKSINVGWFCTPFDISSVEYLANLGMKIWKIPSNSVVVKRIDVVKKIMEFAYGNVGKVYFSTGASSDVELEMYSKMIIPGKITWLYCVPKYPCPIKEINLKRMSKLKDLLSWPDAGSEFNLKIYPQVGFSDHSLSIVVPVVAVTLGASVIEKHLTLDRNAEGPDHKASLEPHEFAEMVRQIREVEKAL